ncbi:hypothetical protein SAMD00019534_055930, partial [Acytostelium subglobosum LB1]|uniref:hypothetical protein n=1 Tax=Acytostelium subglobosum LB1 TaxID=1410327 RepID=UPI0006448E1D
MANKYCLDPSCACHSLTNEQLVLLDASLHHLRYELNMLCTALNMDLSSVSDFVKNTVVESAAVHWRQIYEALHNQPKKRVPDDLHPYHWDSSKYGLKHDPKHPLPSLTSDPDLKERVDQQIVHLTALRYGNGTSVKVSRAHLGPTTKEFIQYINALLARFSILKHRFEDLDNNKNVGFFPDTGVPTVPVALPGISLPISYTSPTGPFSTLPAPALTPTSGPSGTVPSCMLSMPPTPPSTTRVTDMSGSFVEDK